MCVSISLSVYTTKNFCKTANRESRKISICSEKARACGYRFLWKFCRNQLRNELKPSKNRGKNLFISEPTRACSVIWSSAILRKKKDEKPLFWAFYINVCCLNGLRYEKNKNISLKMVLCSLKCYNLFRKIQTLSIRKTIFPKHRFFQFSFSPCLPCSHQT